MSINAIGTNIPIQVAKGGLGTASLTQYGVLYGNGTAPVGVTGVGTALQVLTSNGPGFAPSFQSLSVVPGGGAWTLIQTQTAAASANLTFNTGLSSTYTNLIFLVSGILSDTPNDTFQMQVSLDGGATFPLYSSGGQGGQVAYLLGSSGSSTTWNAYPANVTSSLSRIPLSSNIMATTGPGLSGTYYYFNANVSTNTQMLRGEWLMVDQNGTIETGLAAGNNVAATTTTVNAFRFIMALGNILSGTISLYGLRHS